MRLLNDQIARDVRNMLADLPNPVRLVVFTSPQNCEYCEQIVQLVTEVAETSDKVSVEQYDIHQAADKAKSLNVDTAPAIAILGPKDYGLRFYGIPSGYEFSTLLHGIRKASSGQSELDSNTQDFLRGLTQPVELKVFVTPTCPYCPRGATLAYEMATVSDMVSAKIFEAMEFPVLAEQYNVMGVPLTVVNDRERIEGAAPPHMVVHAIQQALA